MAEEIRTTCPYCGVGCGVIARKDADGTVAVTGDPDHPANFGRLCVKGATLAETLGLDGRLLHPRIDGRRAGWDETLQTVAGRLSSIVAEHGPDSIAFYVSGQFLTEDYYVANKLLKGFVGTANIDTNSRLCMASSVAGHVRAFGSDTVPGTYDDIEQCDLAVLVGSNMAWCHPVLYQRLMAAKAKRPGLRIVVIDPRRTATCEEADLHLAPKPGADAVIFNGLLSHLADLGLVDRIFVNAHTTGIDEALTTAGPADMAQLAAQAGLDPADLALFYGWFAGTERVVTFYSQGINQSSSGTDKVNAIINCHLLTGRIGRPGLGPFSLTGQPNAMGGREVGGLANQLAAHMRFEPEAIDRVRRFWNAPHMAQGPGLKAVELFDAIHAGKVKAVWIMATNPVVSLPNAALVRDALAKCDLVIVSDITAETDTAAFAHILLPALAWGEKDGTVTNSERRISRQRAFLPPPGEAKPDWWILAQVARRMGFDAAFAYDSPAEIFAEHARLSAFENDGARDFDIGGLARADFATLAPVQWPAPCPPSQDKRPKAEVRLFADGRFFHPDGKARFVPVIPRAPASEAGPDFSLVLNTGRLRDQWHTMTRTGKVARLMSHASTPRLSIHPSDAMAHGLAEGDFTTVVSPLGQRAIIAVTLDPGQRPGEVFMAMHWNRQFAADAGPGPLLLPFVDPVSGQPELKHSPVRLSRWAPDWQGILLSRTERHPFDAPLWSRATRESCIRYTLAGTSLDRPWADIALEWMSGKAAGDIMEFSDRGRGLYRAATFLGGRLEAALFISPPGFVFGTDAVEGLFARDVLRSNERLALLMGVPVGAGQPSAPRDVVCACFQVGAGEIRAQAAQGANSVALIGAATQAGTNCGSCRPEITRLLRPATKSGQGTLLRQIA